VVKVKDLASCPLLGFWWRFGSSTMCVYHHVA